MNWLIAIGIMAVVIAAIIGLAKLAQFFSYEEKAKRELKKANESNYRAFLRDEIDNEEYGERTASNINAYNQYK